MFRGIVLAMVFLLSGSSPFAQAGNNSCPYKSLLETEYAFAHQALATGIRSSFLQYLDDDAVVFRPGPTPGRKIYTDQKESGAWLHWRPQYAGVSADGDLGFTTGPWEYRDSASGPVIVHGQFVSVWRRRQGGLWKLAANIGISYEESGSFDSLEIPRNCDTSKTVDHPLKNREAELHDLLGIDSLRQFVDTRGINSLFDPQAILCIDGTKPSFGTSAVGRRGGDVQSGEWIPQFADAARSGDLAYTYGERHYATKGKCTYLRVWRRGIDNSWKILIQVEGALWK